MSQKIWFFIVFILSAGGYVPVIIGGLQHPAEINVATYSLWLVITGTMFYAMRLMRQDGWIMPLGWFFGNGCMLVTAFFLDGSTFNLTATETSALYGLVLTIVVWGTVWKVTKKSEPRILLLGTILSDIGSFYPQLKQYLLPHENPTDWMLLGWGMFLAGALCNLVFVEKMFTKLRMEPVQYMQVYKEPKRTLLIFEKSVLSAENIILITVTILVMIR